MNKINFSSLLALQTLLLISTYLVKAQSVFVMKPEYFLPNFLPEVPYQIECKGTQKVLDVWNNSQDVLAPVWQYEKNLTDAQKFIFVDKGNANFNIRTLAGHYLTASPNTPDFTIDFLKSSTNKALKCLLIQDKLYFSTPIQEAKDDENLTGSSKSKSRQLWKFVPTGEPFTFFIQNNKFPNKYLQPIKNESGISVDLVDSTGSDMQKWIVKRPKRNTAEANIGYSSLVIDASTYDAGRKPAAFAATILDKLNIHAEDFNMEHGKVDIDLVLPQHRYVGETSVQSSPNHSYEILEGVVAPENCHIAQADFPINHFTHDFDFNVIPNPEFEYLLSAHVGYGPQNSEECKLVEQINAIKKHLSQLRSELAKANFNDKVIIREEILEKEKEQRILINKLGNRKCSDSFHYFERQKIIPVEWETGLASRNSTQNKQGKSFGFFSEGHEAKDIIWNWPTPGDWVHVEGIWIWDRGHSIKTEMHPPHLVAIQRNAPVSFNLNNANEPIINNDPSDKYIATRCDIYASADGSTHWNTKNIPAAIGNGGAFAQVVDMKRKDYVFNFSHTYSKPGSNARLKWIIMNQKGNTFPSNIVISQTKDNEVQVTIPWKSANIDNLKKLCQTILLYWENPQGTSVKESEVPVFYSIHINDIAFKNYLDDSPSEFFCSIGDNISYGDQKIFMNIANEWFFLNEYRDGNQYLSTITENKIIVNKNVKIAVKKGSSFRILTCGWEDDGIGAIMGATANTYNRQQTPNSLKIFFQDNLAIIYCEGEEDDEIGEINKVIGQPSSFPFGLQTLSSIHDGKNIFDLTFSIIEIK